MNQQGLQDVPAGNAGWYSPGARPGQRGNVVLVGHTPGIFNGLTKLKPGDKIYIGRYTYQVDKKVLYKVSEFPTQTIYGPSNGFNLNLITCTGRDYRTVIFSHLSLTPG